jgi:hypothetical protein
MRSSARRRLEHLRTSNLKPSGKWSLARSPARFTSQWLAHQRESRYRSDTINPGTQTRELPGRTADTPLSAFQTIEIPTIVPEGRPYPGLVAKSESLTGWGDSESPRRSR